MKPFTGLRAKTQSERTQKVKPDTPEQTRDKKVSRTALYAGIFYLLMMALYAYFMLANLSSSPKYVYTQF